MIGSPTVTIEMTIHTQMKIRNNWRSLLLKSKIVGESFEKVCSPLTPCRCCCGLGWELWLVLVIGVVLTSILRADMHGWCQILGSFVVLVVKEWHYAWLLEKQRVMKVVLLTLKNASSFEEDLWYLLRHQIWNRRCPKLTLGFKSDCKGLGIFYVFNCNTSIIW